MKSDYRKASMVSLLGCRCSWQAGALPVAAMCTSSCDCASGLCGVSEFGYEKGIFSPNAGHGLSDTKYCLYSSAVKVQMGWKQCVGSSGHIWDGELPTYYGAALLSLLANALCVAGQNCMQVSSAATNVLKWVTSAWSNKVAGCGLSCILPR